ncbi:nuclear transport factor 2 family protein [Aeoliella sp. ICT_H6.2]|uniref:Nuclear transport factor 2 family protein n=1 Tax=Aeoliella straminimaris TaxID=2954799 RepID=A0A9X2JIX8_9BACT|nr:nuclear transport factor 2 family protein [Aeoliella straminimaris]MCO6047560.1 nuclear transport factor 2 family protein [Aeoliella straminimaris]
MNRQVQLAVLTVLVCLASQRVHADEHVADREALLELKAIAEKAMSEEDQIQTLGPHVTDDFSIVTFTSRQFDDFDVFVKEWNISREKFLQGGTYSVKLAHEPATFDGDIATCHGNSTNIMTTGEGQRYEFNSPWTAVFRKENGQWKLLRAHSSINPFSNPVLDANIQKYLWMIGISAGFIGLVVGLLAAKWIARGKTKPTE